MAIAAPLSSFSGYGQYSRNIIKSLIQLYSEKYRMIIIDFQSGSPTQSYMKSNHEYDIILKYLQDRSILDTEFVDLYIQISAAQAFQCKGLYNIGITAVTQSIPSHPSIIQGCNRMDLVIVMSQFNKTVLELSKFTTNKNTTVQIKTPVETLFHGISKYPQNKTEDHVIRFLDSIKQKYCFLFHGQWLPGSLGCDRKNIGMLINTFNQTFVGNKDVALVLKTSIGFPGVLARYEIEQRITALRSSLNVPSKQIPSIYIIQGEIPKQTLIDIYRHPKIKTFITFTHGQSYGIPIAEFAANTEKPILSPYWSGHTQFLPPEFNSFFIGKQAVMPAEILQIPMYQTYFVPQSKWYNIDYKYASVLMKEYYTNYESKLQKSKQQNQFILKNFSYQKMKQKVQQIITKYQSDSDI